ncbi:hypothetical protein IGI75_003403 [Enterococcus sp. DIV2469a]
MTHTEHTTKSRKGKHLSFDERQLIAYLKNKLGLSNRAIAKELGRAPQTIHNEIKDGTVEVIKQRQIHRTKQYDYRKTEYSPEAGQAAYDTARLNSGRTYLWVESTDFIDYADDQILRLYQSPDSVVGAAKVSRLFPEKMIPCTKTLYNWIDKGFMETQNIDLILKVRRETKSIKNRKNKTFLGKSIDLRPEHVTSREEFGHWEIDTVVGLKSFKKSKVKMPWRFNLPSRIFKSSLDISLRIYLKRSLLITALSFQRYLRVLMASLRSILRTPILHGNVEPMKDTMV